jgi:hypothetical protein
MIKLKGILERKKSYLLPENASILAVKLEGSFCPITSPLEHGKSLKENTKISCEHCI